MRDSIPTPVAIGLAVFCVLLAIVVGWKYLGGANRDKNGQDQSKPAVQPANMGEMMKSHMGGNRGTGGPMPSPAPSR